MKHLKFKKLTSELLSPNGLLGSAE